VYLVQLTPSRIGVVDRKPYVLGITTARGFPLSILGTREEAERRPMTRAEAEALRDRWMCPGAVRVVRA
jgi:hypothetical protein